MSTRPHTTRPPAIRSQLRATRLLSQADVDALIDMRAAMRVIEHAFRAQGQGQISMPPKVYLTLPDGGDFRAMPAAMSHPPASGIKWVNVHPNNRAKGLPTVMALAILNDPSTGFPLAVIDGVSITRLRTGAAAGVAARALARRDSRTAALVGCGAQAFTQLEALAHAFRLRRVAVWGAASGEAARFARAAGRVARCPIVPAPDIKTCVADADLIVTITPSRAPLVMRPWVKPGAHVNAVGADAPGKQELDPALLRDATIVVDEREQAIHGGELNVPISRGLFSPDAIHGTLADVLLRRVRGRTRDDEITVFDSTGIAVHDVALAAAVFRAAIRRRRGRTFQFFNPRA